MNLSESLAFWIIVFSIPSVLLVSIGVSPIIVIWLLAMTANYLIRRSLNNEMNSQETGETVYEYRHATA